MNYRAVKIISFVSILCAAFLSSCGGMNHIPQITSTKTPTGIPPQTSTHAATAVSETDIIEPENINKLQISQKWGKGDVYGVALSPDGTEIAVSTVTGVYLYDYDTLESRLG